MIADGKGLAGLLCEIVYGIWGKVITSYLDPDIRSVSAAAR